jgi:hypothetical protein
MSRKPTRRELEEALARADKWADEAKAQLERIDAAAADFRKTVARRNASKGGAAPRDILWRAVADPGIRDALVADPRVAVAAVARSVVKVLDREKVARPEPHEVERYVRAIKRGLYAWAEESRRYAKVEEAKIISGV